MLWIYRGLYIVAYLNTVIVGGHKAAVRICGMDLISISTFWYPWYLVFLFFNSSIIFLISAVSGLRSTSSQLILLIKFGQVWFDLLIYIAYMAGELLRWVVVVFTIGGTEFGIDIPPPIIRTQN